MKNVLLTLAASLMTLTASAQAPFGFGGQQVSAEDMHYSQKFTDVNYADDGQAYHTMDIYLPEKKADKYPVVVHIYGSAWFSNSSKGMADLGTICTALLKAGYAVVCPNHRSSADAKWPAQSHDIKAAIRYLRGNAEKYHLDADHIATSGFSSGGHLSSMMAATTGTKTAKVGSLDVDIEGNIGKYTSFSSAIFAAVDWSGPIDLENMDCAGKRNMPNSPEEALLGCPLTKENHDRYASLSPITYLDKNDAPTIVFHGTADNVVPFCQGEEWTLALEKAGVKTEFYPVKDGGHGFNMYSEENLGRMVKFLDAARGSKKKVAASSVSNNPIIQTWYTPDPAPYVHNDTVYLFVDHDEDQEIGFFNMKDWQLYSSVDMVNWTYRGTPLNLSVFKWAKQDNDAWASQAIERNGKWYWYVAVRDNSNGQQGIGVAVADSPEGPYTDPIGKALVPGAWGFIDPSVFIDNDGQAYLFWGNNGLWYAKLNEDMVSLAEEFKEIDTYLPEAFGPHKIATDWSKNMKRILPGFEEAPWVYRIGDTYYLEYAAGGVPEHWAYSTAKSIDGPWTYRGKITETSPNSFTIHGGSITYHDKQYLFYHCGRAVNGHGYHRSSAIEPYELNADGSIPFVPITNEGVTKAVRNLSPYKRVEAETMADSRLMKTDLTQGKNHFICGVQNGAWMRVRSVDFSKKCKSVKAGVRSMKQGTTIEFRADAVDGKLIATLNAPKATSTIGDAEWKTISAKAASLSGVHDIYIVFKNAKENDKIVEMDWWMMK